MAIRREIDEMLIFFRGSAKSMLNQLQKKKLGAVILKFVYFRSAMSRSHASHNSGPRGSVHSQIRLTFKS